MNQIQQPMICLKSEGYEYILLASNITWDELRKINEDTTKEAINNVNYLKSFNFSDGSKGEVYNIERIYNGVKVYCREIQKKQVC